MWEKETCGGEKEKWGTTDSFFSLPAACHLFSHRVIFTRAHFLLTLLSLRKNGGLLVILVVFGLSLLLFPSGDQVIAMLQLLFWSCLSIPVCPKSRNLGDINIYLNQLNEQEILSHKCILFVTYYSCNYINRNITLKILFTFIGAICY